MRTLMAATVLVLISNTTQAKAQLGSLVLYLPDYAMEERISVDDLVDYVAQISELVNKHFLEIDQNADLAAVVAIKNNDMRIWLTTFRGVEENLNMALLAQSVKNIPIPTVTSGVVPFAFSIQVGNSTFELKEPPILPEWHTHLDGNTEITEAIAKAWNANQDQQKHAEE